MLFLDQCENLLPLIRLIKNGIIFPAACTAEKYIDSAASGGDTSDRCHWWKQPKRRQRRIQRGCFEEAARSAAPKGAGDCHAATVFGVVRRGACSPPKAFYGSSRQSGMDIHLGPPRPRDSSALGMTWSFTPASSSARLVT